MGHRLQATENGFAGSSLARPAIASLQAKGTCWYCDQVVDNVRRFCSPACRNDYLEEEAGYFNGNSSSSPPAAT